jgi:hypothetical protein
MHMRHAKRQNSDITQLPSGVGISGSRTAGSPSETQLVVGTNTGLSITDGPDFAPGSVLIFTVTSITVLTAVLHSRTSIIVTSTRADEPSQSPTESPALSGAKSVIPLSAVIGACVGAFVGAGLLICLGVWFYRRSSRRPPPRGRQKQPLAQARGVNPNAPWTRFGEELDKWEGRNEMTEKGARSAALPSGTQRTTGLHLTGKSQSNDDKRQHGATRQLQPFSDYHPGLAEQMALEPPRPVGVDDQPKSSLDGSTAGTLLSLGTVHIESGKMSPTFNVAKTTPPATTSRLHQWESAEVVDPDAHGQEVEVHPDPFSAQSTPTTYSTTETFGDRRSLHNPFFNAHLGSHSQHPSAVRKSPAVSESSDPFDEEETMTIPKPKFISHMVHDSSSSGGSIPNERSMQSLIAALELPQDIIEQRLRAASMAPSDISRYSTGMDSYTIPMPETAERGYMVR